MSFRFKESCYFFLPSLLFSLFSIYLFDNFRLILKEIIAFSLLNFICLAVIIPFSNGESRYFGTLLLQGILSIISFVKLGFVLLYGAPLSSSALFVLFETNQNEALEYLKTYFDSKLLLLFSCHLICFYLVVKFLIKNDKNSIFNILFSWKIKLMSFSIALLALFLLQKKFYKQDVFFATYYAYIDYKTYKNGLNNQLSQSKPSSKFNITFSGHQPQTHIVVIGESLTRRHMSLYDYPRNTNPKLKEIEKELLIFNKVISPHTHTMPALEKILTLHNFEQPNLDVNMSVVQMANAAGFETYWISNQQPLGVHETLPTIIANASTNKYWMETNDFGAVIYDEKLLPKLKEVLDKPEGKKVIFLHLIGTHAAYDRRYPQQYNYFKDAPPIAISKERKVTNNVNYYDNAVRYNDYIVKSILTQLKQKNLFSSLIYFSDHGEEVFESIDFMGHHEYFSTKAMYEVPFMFWFSDEYKKANAIDVDALKLTEDRKYILEDFPHTFADVVGLKFQGYDAEKSIINASFKEKKRVIRNNRDYDKW